MASVKIVLRPEKKQDGTHALAIKITKDRKTSFAYLDFCIKPEDWDVEKQRVKKSNPNHARLNNFLLKELSKANEAALELQTTKTHVSAKAVKEKIQPLIASTFFPQADAYLDGLKAAGKYNRWTPDKSHLKHFKEFMKGADIAFSDITIALLEKFKVFVKNTNVSDRTVVNHLVAIRSVFSFAIKHEVCDPRFYPFG